MACNCTTTEQLNLLYEKYSDKKKEPLTTGQKIKYYINKTIVSLMMLIIFPFLILFVLYVSTIGDKKISLRKFFRLKNQNIEDYVGKQ